MQPPLPKRQEVGGADPHPGGVIMARRAVPPSLWSGNERLRIGERLQACLAGLLELDLLRETQREAVERALERRQEDGARQQVRRGGGGRCGVKVCPEAWASRRQGQ